MTEQLFMKQMGIFTDPTRLKIISALAKSNFCSMHLEQLTGASQPNVSRHIDKMVMAQIVDVKKVGRRNVYKLNDRFKANNQEIIKQVEELYTAEFSEEEIKQFSEECKSLS